MRAPNFRKNGASITAMITNPASAADHQAQGVEADEEEGAGHGDDAGGTERRLGDAETGVARGHAAAGGKELQGLARRHQEADGGVERQGPEQHAPSEHHFGGAELLEDDEQQHEAGERAGEDAEIGAEPRIDEAGARGGDRHSIRTRRLSQVSSCAPCQWSMASWRLTKLATVKIATMAIPCALRK